MQALGRSACQLGQALHAQGECVCGARDGGAPIPRRAAPLELSWQDLTCDVLSTQTLKPKRVLHQASGFIKPGELVALVGPSGAGMPPFVCTP